VAKTFEIGYIYKITNNINNKLYIGQTTESLERRWLRHQRYSIGKNALNTKFSRAIRKYGVDNFTIEEIERLEHCTRKQLTEREHFWVIKLDTIETGYNVQDPLVSCGGNTYAGKSESEMVEIKEKLRQTKLSGKNPHAHAVKCLNIETSEILYFETVEDARRYFNHSNHAFVTSRCKNLIKCPFLGKYKFAYKENEFI
jgi:group I intron endonuclease